MCHGAATVTRDEADANENTGAGWRGRARDHEVKLLRVLTSSRQRPRLPFLLTSQRYFLSSVNCPRLQIAIDSDILEFCHSDTI